MKAKNSVRLAAVATVLSIAVAAPAFAADMIEPAPEPAPVDIVPSASTGWAGPYVGATGAYNFGKAKAQPLASRNKREGFGGGVFAGVQGQSGNIVYGVEGDVGYNGAEGRNSAIRTRAGVDGSVRARLGYAVNDRVLVYSTAGGAAEQLKVSDGLGADDHTMLGYTVGAGVDAKITDNVFGRVEYRYSDFGNKNYNLGGGTQRIDSETNKINLGVGLKF